MASKNKQIFNRQRQRVANQKSRKTSGISERYGGDFRSGWIARPSRHRGIAILGIRWRKLNKHERKQPVAAIMVCIKQLVTNIPNCSSLSEIHVGFENWPNRIVAYIRRHDLLNYCIEIGTWMQDSALPWRLEDGFYTARPGDKSLNAKQVLVLKLRPVGIQDLTPHGNKWNSDYVYHVSSVPITRWPKHATASTALLPFITGPCRYPIFYEAIKRGLSAHGSIRVDNLYSAVHGVYQGGNRFKIDDINNNSNTCLRTGVHVHICTKTLHDIGIYPLVGITGVSKNTLWLLGDIPLKHGTSVILSNLPEAPHVPAAWKINVIKYVADKGLYYAYLHFLKLFLAGKITRFQFFAELGIYAPAKEKPSSKRSSCKRGGSKSNRRLVQGTKRQQRCRFLQQRDKALATQAKIDIFLQDLLAVKEAENN